jgi:hypothetical protein
MLLANNWTTWSLEVIPTTGGPILTASPIFIKSFKKSTKAMFTTERTKNTINTQPNNRGRDQIGEIDICIQQLLFRIGQYALMARKMHSLWLRRSLKCWLTASLKMSCAARPHAHIVGTVRYASRSSWYSALGSCSATLSGCNLPPTWLSVFWFGRWPSRCRDNDKWLSTKRKVLPIKIWES